MIIGIPKEISPGETRVATTPEIIKRQVKKGYQFIIEREAGLKAGFVDQEYIESGAQISESSDRVFQADVVLKVQKPTADEILKMKKESLLLSFLEPYKNEGLCEKLCEMKIQSVAVELLPRTSRAQSMDALSSQANIAGYKAVLEACHHFGRFVPMMMTSAGSAKPARVAVLGVGVAGLQAISTAKRLGGVVEAYDVRPEVKEQIKSVGAKVIELELEESGSGSGGYAKELSEEAKLRQQASLTEKLKKFDIIISTANIPGRKSPVLITEEAVNGMRAGSVIVDMAAANGGNCALSEADKTISKNGVIIIGETNFPRLMPSDASNFYGRNLINLLALFIDEKTMKIQYNLDDDIVSGSLYTFNGEGRKK